MSLQILKTEKLSPEKNMELDATLLQSLEKDPRTIVHLYQWEGPCATYGYFMDPHEYLKVGHQLKVARRPTGGGMIFHHCDLAFAVLIPSTPPGFSVNTLANYAFVNEAVLQAIQKFYTSDPALFQGECQQGGCSDFCMAKPTIYDVMIRGKKVGGGAQRRTKYGLLHQGTIALTLTSKEFLMANLMNGAALYDQMHAHSLSLLAQDHTIAQFKAAFKNLETLLIAELGKRLCLRTLWGLQHPFYDCIFMQSTWSLPFLQYPSDG